MLDPALYVYADAIADAATLIRDLRHGVLRFARQGDLAVLADRLDAAVRLIRANDPTCNPCTFDE